MLEDRFIEEIVQPVEPGLFIEMIEVFSEAANSSPPPLIGHASQIDSAEFALLVKLQHPLDRGLHAVEMAVKKGGRSAFRPYVERIRLLDQVFDNDADFGAYFVQDPDSQDAKYMSHDLLEALAKVPLLVSAGGDGFEWDIPKIKLTLAK